jgi:hypothetical protein
LRHRDDGAAGAEAFGDSLAKPVLARKFPDNAVRSLPEERAAEIAAERSPFLTLRASGLSSRS